MSLFNLAQRWFSGLKLRASSYVSLASKKRCTPSHADRLAVCAAGAERTCVKPHQAVTNGNDATAVATLVVSSPAVTEPKICVYFPRNDPDALPPTVSPAVMKLRAENQAKYLVRSLTCAFDRAAVREIDGQSHTAKLKSVQADLLDATTVDLGSQAPTTAPVCATTRPRAELQMAYKSQSSTASESSDASQSEHGQLSAVARPAAAMRTPAVTAIAADAKRTRASLRSRVPLRQRVLEYQQQLKQQQQPCKPSPPPSSTPPTISSVSLRHYRITDVAYQRPRVPVPTGPMPQLDVGARYNDYTQTAQFQAKRQQNLALQQRLAARRKQMALERANKTALASKSTQPDPVQSAAPAARSRTLTVAVGDTLTVAVGDSEPRHEVAARYIDYTQSARYQDKRQWNLERRRQLDTQQQSASNRVHKSVHTPSAKTVKIHPAASRPKDVASRVNAYRTNPRWLPRRAENRERAAKVGVVRTVKSSDPSPSLRLVRPSSPRSRIPLRLRVALRLTLAHEFARELSLFQYLLSLSALRSSRVSIRAAGQTFSFNFASFPSPILESNFQTSSKIV